SRPKPPCIEPGTFCTHPYRCEFFDHCHPASNPDDVRSLPIPSDKIRMLLHYGVTSISELPTATDLKLYWHFTNRECSRVDGFRHARSCGAMAQSTVEARIGCHNVSGLFHGF